MRIQMTVDRDGDEVFPNTFQIQRIEFLGDVMVSFYLQKDYDDVNRRYKQCQLMEKDELCKQKQSTTLSWESTKKKME